MLLSFGHPLVYSMALWFGEQPPLPEGNTLNIQFNPHEELSGRRNCSGRSCPPGPAPGLWTLPVSFPGLPETWWLFAGHISSPSTTSAVDSPLGISYLPGPEFPSFFLFSFFNKFIYLFLAVLCLRCCVWAFSSCGKWGLCFRCGAQPSHCSGFSYCGAWALGVRPSVVVAHGLSSCGSWALDCRLSSCGTQAQLLRGMWDLPGPGLEPVSPALAGGFLTTAPPGKPQNFFRFFFFF